MIHTKRGRKPAFHSTASSAEAIFSEDRRVKLITDLFACVSVSRPGWRARGNVLFRCCCASGTVSVPAARMLWLYVTEFHCTESGPSPWGVGGREPLMWTGGEHVSPHCKWICWSHQQEPHMLSLLPVCNPNPTSTSVNVAVTPRRACTPADVTLPLRQKWPHVSPLRQRIHL